MKIYTSNYRNHWISPYTVLDHMFFWTDWSKCSRDKTIVIRSLEEERNYKYVDHPEWVEKWADRLVPISRAIQRVLDFVHPQINYVKIDKWDTWSMDHTLSYIILPMLKQLKATQHGSPFVDDEDVPTELKSWACWPKENEWDTDLNHHKRWVYVLDEIIFAFEHKVDDSWQDAYRSGEHDILWVPVDVKGNEVPKGEHKYTEMRRGPNDTYVCDYDGIKKVEERMANGFRLFGKYYQGLWD
jgi:hypothetical protein